MVGKGKVQMGRGKKNEENLYEQIESDFQEILLSTKKRKFKNNIYSILSFMLERSRNKMYIYLLITTKSKNRKQQQHRKNQLANKNRWLLTRGWESIWLSILRDGHIFCHLSLSSPLKTFPI